MCDTSVLHVVSPHRGSEVVVVRGWGAQCRFRCLHVCCGFRTQSSSLRLVDTVVVTLPSNFYMDRVCGIGGMWASLQ